MISLLRVACLALSALLGACSLPYQSFSCESGETYRTGDMATTPAIVSPRGYRHC